LAGLANDYQPRTGCFFGTGRDYVATVSVPQGQRLTLTVAASAVDTSISLLPASADCGSAACVGGSNSGGTGGTDTATYDNRTGQPVVLLVVVDSNSVVGTAANFTLTATAAALPPVVTPGETCAAAVVVLTSGTISGDLGGLANDFLFADGNACFGNQPSGPDGVYSIDVPAGNRLTATLTPTFDALLNAVRGPAANCGSTGPDGGTIGIACVAASDNFGVSSETLTYINRNTDGGSETIFLLVDSTSPSPTSTTYDLTTSVAPLPPPYTKTTIATACDTLSTPTILLNSTTTPAIGDDETSATVAIPFGFSWFTAAATHFSANTNGLMQIHASGSASGSTAYSNAAIPTASTPNSLIAAYWDDGNSTATAEMRYQVFGTAPNRRLTVEWFDMTLFSSSGSRLTYQVQLFETSNVVEIHYCSLTGADGASATVGIEDQAGATGVEHSFNTAASVSTANAFRFTP